MSSRKLKATTLRRHKNSKPYERPKGIVATVKNWLAPSSWFSWGGTGEGRDQDASTSNEPFLPSPPPGFLDGLRDNKLVMHESVDSKIEEEDRQSSEEEMEDAPHSPPSSHSDQQSQSSQPLPAVSQITPPLHKQMPFNRNGIVINRGASIGTSDGATSTSHRTTSGVAAGSGGVSPPANAERRWHTIQAVHQSWKSPLTTASTGVGPAARSPPVTVDQLSSRYQTTPGFSINTFHTPSSHLSAHSISRSPFRSPYYSGRTSFGGMASKQKLTNKRARLDTSPVAALPVRQTVKARQIVQDKRATTTSQLSQRILDTLQSLGSPLSDARKLPLRPAKRMKVDASVKDSSASVSSPTLPPPPVNPLLTINPPTSSLSRSSHRAAVPVSQSPVLSPPPSTSSPIKHYTPPTSQLPAVTTTTTTQSPSISMDKGGGGGGGKMKRDKQSLHFTRQPDQQNLNPSPLPPPISLSVPSSSPFSIPFSLPSSSTLPTISTSSPSVFSRGNNIQPPTVKAPLSIPNTSLGPFGATTLPTVTTSTSSSFGFAKPTVLSGAVTQTSSIKQGSSFQFSSPHHVTAASKKLSSSHQTATSLTTASPPTVQLNKPQKTSSPAPNPSPFKPMSVLEALKRPEYKLENIRKDAAAAETIDLTSDDDDDDDEEEVKEISKSKEKDSASVTSVSTTQSKPLALPSTILSSSSWTCDDCWVSNKDSSSSCVACGANKPGTKPASSSKPAAVFSGLSSSNKPGSTSLNSISSLNNSGSTLPSSNNPGPGSSSSSSSAPSSSWTCNDCWVNNKDTSLTCVACGGKKPGSNPVSSAATTVLGEGTTSVDGGLSLSTGAAGGLKLSSGGLMFGNQSTSSNTSSTASVLSGGFKLPTGASGLLSSGSNTPSSTSSSTGSSLLMGNNGGLKLSSGGLLLGGSGGTLQLQASSSNSSNVLGSSGGGFKPSTGLSSSGNSLLSAPSGGIALGSGGITLSASPSPLLTSMKPSQPSSVSSSENSMSLTATTLSTQATSSLFGTTNKTTITDAVQSSKEPPSLSQFAPPAGNWSCDTCLVSNNPDSEQCVACSTPKPGAKKAVPAAGQLGSGTTLFGGGIKLSTGDSSGGLSLTGGLQLGTKSSTVGGLQLEAKSNTSGGLQIGAGLSSLTSNQPLGGLAMNGKLLNQGSGQEKTTSLLAVPPAFNATSLSSGIQLGTGMSTATTNAPFSFTGSLMSSVATTSTAPFGSPMSTSAASVLSNLKFSIPPPPVTTTSPQPSPTVVPSMQAAAAPPSFIFSGSKQPSIMTTSSGGGLFGAQSILPAATAAGGSSALGIGTGFFGNKATTSTEKSSIFQPPANAAPSFNFSGGSAPSGPVPFMFGQQTPAANSPTNPAASSTLFSSTPKINFAAQSGASGAGGGIFSQLAEQSQSGSSSSMFQFSASSSSLPQQPLAIGGGLPNPFNNSGSVMQFGATDGAVGGSVFSAGLGGGTKRVIKKAARRKK